MVCILERHSRDKIAMARPNEPDMPGMPPKQIKKAGLGHCCTQFRPSDIIAVSSQWLYIAGYQHSSHAFWLAKVRIWVPSTYRTPFRPAHKQRLQIHILYVLSVCWMTITYFDMSRFSKAKANRLMFGFKLLMRLIYYLMSSSSENFKM